MEIVAFAMGTPAAYYHTKMNLAVVHLYCAEKS